MKTFIWYSKGSEDSGKMLARLLGVGDSHGTNPPKGFTGLLINFGGTPSDKFQWDERKFRAIINDPRSFKDLKDKHALYTKLRNAGLSVITSTDAPARYADTPLYMCKPSGIKPLFVDSQEKFRAAVAKGNTLAVDRSFLAEDRNRVVVFNGAVVSNLKVKRKEVVDDDTVSWLLEESGEELTAGEKEKVKKLLAGAASSQKVSFYRYLWEEGQLAGDRVRAVAKKVFETLKANFFAMDYLITANGSVVVTNVVFAPDLVSVPTQHVKIAKTFSDWMKSNTKSSKEMVREIAEMATEEEAEGLLEVLRNIKTKKSA